MFELLTLEKYINVYSKLVLDNDLNPRALQECSRHSLPLW